MKRLASILILWLAALPLCAQEVPYFKVPGGRVELRYVPDAAPVPTRWLGTNIERVIDFAPTKPFTNFAYQTRPWISSTKNTWDDKRPIAQDDRGNVVSLLDGQFATMVLFSVDRPSYELEIQWEGDGTIEFKGMKTVAAGFRSRTVIPDATGNVFLQITKAPISNITVHKLGEVRTLFNQVLVDDLRRYACIRFMDWQLTNFQRTLPSYDFAPLDRLPVRFSEGVPLSVMVELCNQTGCDGWFCVPVNADAAYQDTFLQALKSLKTRAYVELGNEVWNGAFPASRYWDADWNKNMQRFCVENAKLAAKVEATLGDKGVSVAGAQAANAWWVGNALKLMKDAGTLPNAVAIAPYFGAARKPGLPDDVILFDNGGVSADIDQAIQWTKDCKVQADKFGVKLVCYESGQHYIPGVAMSRDPRMKDAYVRYFEGIKPLVDMACHFSYVTSWGKDGSWGEGNSIPPTGPKAEAVRTIQGE
jgi:hypothetical protein